MIITGKDNAKYLVSLEEAPLGNQLRISRMVFEGFSNTNRYYLKEVLTAKGWSMDDAKRWCNL